MREADIDCFSLNDFCVSGYCCRSVFKENESIILVKNDSLMIGMYKNFGVSMS